jgi:hypothetical protein
MIRSRASTIPSSVNYRRKKPIPGVQSDWHNRSGGFAVKRSGIIAGIVVAIGMGGAEPAMAAGDGPCDGASCGKPQCWDPTVRLRPDRARAARIRCYNAKGARLLSAPQHVDISNVSTDQEGVRFDARPRDGAPRFDSAVFAVDGPDGAIEYGVTLETIPLSENSAPVCLGSRTVLRSDGQGPVTLWLYPSCQDAEGDGFLVEGGGPGAHLDSPKNVSAAQSWFDWRYRTATHAGTETTTVWATDELGARSSDARFEITVGPDVDQLPECFATPGLGGSPITIGARPGAIRRFGVFCSDQDGDAVAPRVSTPPQRGSLLAVPTDPVTAAHGHAKVDATYTPAGDSLEPDLFAFTPGGPHGDGPTAQMAIAPHPLPENWGGGCGYGSGFMQMDEPGVIELFCADDEGDPLTAEVVTAPKHGTAAVPAGAPAPYGQEAFPIAYVPSAGYEGYDCIRVRISDGHGFEITITIDIWIEDRPLPQVYTWPFPPSPPLPPPPMIPGPPGPSGAPPAPPRSIRRGMAQQALGTTSVKRLRSDRGAEVWASSRLSRRGLLRTGRAPGLFVICLERCQIKSDSALASGVRSTRRKVAAVKSAGQAHLVQLELSRGGRTALRRTRKPKARFTLSVRAEHARKGALRRTIRISR